MSPIRRLQFLTKKLKLAERVPQPFSVPINPHAVPGKAGPQSTVQLIKKTQDLLPAVSAYNLPPTIDRQVLESGFSKFPPTGNYFSIQALIKYPTCLHFLASIWC
jgi:hypothetical protein